MKEIIVGIDGVGALSWIGQDKIEEKAMAQIRNISCLPFAFHHVAIMPDTHMGYGMPIGAVLATDGVVIPHAVGTDIGCGMRAVKTNLECVGLDDLKEIMGLVRTLVPMGKGKSHKRPQPKAYMPVYAHDERDFKANLPIAYENYNNATKQLGTLGDGNHFIEFQMGSDGFVWIMIHTGSRNLGYRICEHYNKLAVELNKRWHVKVPPEYGLAFLPDDSNEGWAYIREMQYCVAYAEKNRELMMERILDAVAAVVPTTCFYEAIDVAHNYAAHEEHYDKRVWIHRKGATSAREMQLGIIPGSQGTKSYIVEGKGNPESFMSCSHGAGRVMSRRKAIKNLDLEEEQKRLDDVGIIHAIRHKNDLQEAAGAYKDIDMVIANQEDLIDVCVELTPLGVIKG